MFLLVTALTARADFSYTMTTKASSGMMAGMMGDRPVKYLFKGNKMKTDHGASMMIMDFDAQTITNVHHNQKTYTVTKFGDISSKVGEGMKKSGAEISIDVKETG